MCVFTLRMKCWNNHCCSWMTGDKWLRGGGRDECSLRSCNDQAGWTQRDKDDKCHKTRNNLTSHKWTSTVQKKINTKTKVQRSQCCVKSLLPTKPDTQRFDCKLNLLQSLRTVRPDCIFLWYTRQLKFLKGLLNCNSQLSEVKTANDKQCRPVGLVAGTSSHWQEEKPVARAQPESESLHVNLVLWSDVSTSCLCIVVLSWAEWMMHWGEPST